MENQEKNQTNKYDELNSLASEADKSLGANNNTETETVIKSLEDNQPAPNQETDDGESGGRAGKTKLPGIIDTLKRSLTIYKAKFRSLIILALLPALIGLLMASVGLFSSVLSSGSARSAVLLVMLVVFGLLSIVISILAQVAGILVVAGENSWRLALRQSTPKIWPVLVVSLLTGLAALGGFGLLVVPGIIISVYLMFASFIVILEDKRGLAALSVSFSYVKNNWWQVFVRYLFIVLLFLVVNFIVSLIPLVGSLASIFLGPILLAYFYTVYSDLKKASPAVSAGGKNKFILVFILIGLVVLIIVLAAFPGLIFKLKDILPDNNLPKINNQMTGWQA